MDQDELLINVMREYPPLWDKTNKSYHDKNVKTHCWRTVSNKCFFKSVEACKARWKALREKQRRQENKLKSLTESGIKRVIGGEREWYLMSNMSFLKSNSSYNSSTSDINYDDENSETDDILDVKYKIEEDDPFSINNDESESYEREPQEHHNEVTEQHTETRTSSYSGSQKVQSGNVRVEAFCHYVAEELKVLPKEEADSLMDEFVLSLLNVKKNIRSKIV